MVNSNIAFQKPGFGGGNTGGGVGTGVSSHDALTGVKMAGAGITSGHINDQAQTIAGVKTFSDFPITPSTAPTTDFQAVNKKYVDDNKGLKSVSNTDVDLGTTVIDSFSDTTCEACHWHYVIKNGANLRSGQIMAVWDASSDEIAYNEVSTSDIGDTSSLSFEVNIDSNNLRLLATATSDNWIVKAKRIQI